MGGPRRSDDEVKRRRALVKNLRKRGMGQKAISEKLGVPLRTIQRDYEFLASLYWVDDYLGHLSDEELITFMMGSPEEQQELWEKIQIRRGK